MNLTNNVALQVLKYILSGNQVDENSVSYIVNNFYRERHIIKFKDKMDLIFHDITQKFVS